VKILREIEDVKTNPQHAEEAFIMMIEIAEADGEIEAAERAVLTEVATKLGLSLKAYGL
jgi:tellurite resistance protein TerB